jgi:flagellar basal body-associated protein FliL
VLLLSTAPACPWRTHAAAVVPQIDGIGRSYMECWRGLVWDELTDSADAPAYVTKGTLVMARMMLAVIAAVALAGCANSEAAKRAAAQAAFQAEIKADDAECQSYGAKPDSDAYVQCRLAIDVRKANSEAAAQAARQQAHIRP